MAIWKPALALALACGAAGATTAQPPARPLAPPSAAIEPARLESFVDGLTRGAMASDHIAGVTIAIVQDGRLLLLKGYGLARTGPNVPVDPRRTLFRIGSLTKTFTWIALMQQVERGKMRLDAPVDLYLPAALRTEDPRYPRPIRLIDLISHSAGYENRDIGHLFERDPGRLTPPATYLSKQRPERVREAGLFSTYSNYGTELAGFAVARVAGAPLARVFERDITGPLGMRDTTLREPYPARPDLPAPMRADIALRVSSGFLWQGGRYRPQPFEFINTPAAGSVSSTAADMAAYMSALLNDGSAPGSRIFSPATAAAFRTPVFVRPRGSNGWAHGFQVGELAGRATFGHGGDTQFFHTQLTLIPSMRLGIFVSTNTAGGAPFAKELARHVVEQFYPAPATSAPPAPAPAASVYAGNYVSARRGYSGFQKLIGYLTGAGEVSVTSDGQLVTKTSSTKRWIATPAKGVFRSAEGEGPITFAFDAQGRALRWYTSSGTTAYERVSTLQTPSALAWLALVVLLVATGTLLRWPGRQLAKGDHSTEAYATRVLRATSVAWIASAAAFGASAPQLASGEPSQWPSPTLVTASSLSLVATVGSLALAALVARSTLRPAGRERGGAASWTLARFGLCAIAFLAFASLLAAWGALQPWTD